MPTYCYCGYTDFNQSCAGVMHGYPTSQLWSYPLWGVSRM